MNNGVTGEILNYKETLEGLSGRLDNLSLLISDNTRDVEKLANVAVLESSPGIKDALNKTYSREVDRIKELETVKKFVVEKFDATKKIAGQTTVLFNQLKQHGGLNENVGLLPLVTVGKSITEILKFEKLARDVATSQKKYLTARLSLFDSFKSGQIDESRFLGLSADTTTAYEKEITTGIKENDVDTGRALVIGGGIAGAWFVITKTKLLSGAIGFLKGTVKKVLTGGRA